MKKVFLFVSIAALSTSAIAQVNFGAQVGGNMANVTSESTEGGTTVKDKTKSKFGFLLGVVAQVPLSSSLSFRPELNFIQKGSKQNESSTETFGGSTITSVGKAEITLNFIELPLNIVYSVPAGTGTAFFGAGPSIGYGLSGKSKSDFTVTTTQTGQPTETITESDKSDVKFDGKKDEDVAANDNNAHFKALDFGGNIMAGYKLTNGMYINVGYTMGFSNLNSNANESFKTKGFQVKLGYMFGGNNTED